MADQPSKKAKRQVKNPETFRERALKAVDAANKPDKPSRLRQGGGKVLGPVAKTGRNLSKSKRLKPVRKPLRVASKFILVGYLNRSWQELRLVTWPSRKESRRLTFAVLVFAVVFGAAIAGVDWGLDKVFKQLLLK